MDISLIGFLGNYAGLAGLGTFIYYRDKGLRERINALTQLAKEQKETIEAVRERAIEYDEIRKKYKEALTDFEEMGRKLKVRRDELVKELEDAIAKKDEDQIAEIEQKQKSLERIPKLEEKLKNALEELTKLRSILGLSPLLGIDPTTRDLFEVAATLHETALDRLMKPGFIAFAKKSPE